MRMKGNLPAFFLSLGKFIRSEVVYPEMKSNYLQAIISNIYIQRCFQEVVVGIGENSENREACQSYSYFLYDT